MGGRGFIAFSGTIGSGKWRLTRLLGTGWAGGLMTPSGAGAVEGPW
jgi:hypothetical protein